MMRTLTTLFCVFCVATLLSEVVGVAFLWYRGNLTPETVRDLGVVLTGQNPENISETEQTDEVQPSSDEVIRRRSVRILELGVRENELAILETMVDDKARQLKDQQRQFDQRKKEFEDRLVALQSAVSSEATEAARLILLAMPPDAAMQQLMQLELKEAIVLVQGMPEKSIAKIMQAFADGKPDANGKPGYVLRGQQIFEAISQGGASSELIGQAAKEPDEPPAAAGN